MREITVGDRVYYGTPNRAGTVTIISKGEASVDIDDGRKANVSLAKLTKLPLGEEIQIGDRVYWGKKNALAVVKELGSATATVLIEGHERPRVAVPLAELYPYPEESAAIAVKAEVVIDAPALLEHEQIALREHETTIEKGLKTYMVVGAALLKIRDEKLYRLTHDTFDDYVQKRWGMDRAQAYRDMSAAEVAQNLLPIGNIPTNESQTRLIARLKPDEQREVWTEVLRLTEGKPTAHAVAELLHERGYAVPKSAKGKATYTEEGRDSDELWTPPEIAELSLACLGTIDLDPCSNSMDTPNIPASSHYTKDMDGLRQGRLWAGNVFLNCPYSKPLPWIERLVAEHTSGDVDAALALLPVDPSTKWWGLLRDYPVLFFENRLKFIGATGSARFASALFYLGDDVAKFFECFGNCGEIRRVIEPGVDFGE